MTYLSVFVTVLVDGLRQTYSIHCRPWRCLGIGHDPASVAGTTAEIHNAHWLSLLADSGTTLTDQLSIVNRCLVNGQPCSQPSPTYEEMTLVTLRMHPKRVAISQVTV